MIRSSQFLTLSSATPVTTTLRRTRSTESLESPRKSFTDVFDKSGSPEARSTTGSSFGPAAHNFMTPSGSAPEPLAATHSRAISLDISRSISQPSGISVKGGKLVKEKEKPAATTRPTTPEQFCQLLLNGSSLTVDVEQIKKLRVYLRNEAAGFVLIHNRVLL